MSKFALFGHDSPTDTAYINIRSASRDILRNAREHCEALWDVFHRYADNEFIIEISKDFQTRYWEMYLTVALIDMGYEVICPKQPGPDVGVRVSDNTIWFEATCPKSGAYDSLDAVPQPIIGEAYSVPNEKIILRYLNSVSTKMLQQYPKWINAGVVKTTDCIVIAINPRKLGHEIGDTDPPRLLQAAYGLGPLNVTLARDTLDIVKTEYSFRPQITKSNSAVIDSALFLQDQYRNLSGLLCSRVDPCNRPEEMGGDFQLAPNPNALAPLNYEFRLRGAYFLPTMNTVDGEERAFVVREYSTTPSNRQ